MESQPWRTATGTQSAGLWNTETSPSGLRYKAVWTANCRGSCCSLVSPDRSLDILYMGQRQQPWMDHSYWAVPFSLDLGEGLLLHWLQTCFASVKIVTCHFFRRDVSVGEPERPGDAVSYPFPTRTLTIGVPCHP